MTMSPSSLSVESSPDGAAPSIGKESTSVGSRWPRWRSFSSAIRSSLTNSTATCPSLTPSAAAAPRHSRRSSAPDGPAPEACPSTSTSSMRLRRCGWPGERRDLDDAPIDVLGHLLRVDHVVERVEQRAQVRIDLGHHVAGQEAEALTGLHRRTGQDDAVDLVP